MLFRVFYMLSDHFREFSFGDVLPTLDNLGKTHAELRTVEAESAEDVFRIQQAHNWADDYETCNALLASKGLGHTSMSVGDVVENVATGEYFAVGRIGFQAINNTLAEKLPFRVLLSGDVVAAFGKLSAADEYAAFLSRDFAPAMVRIDTATATLVKYSEGREGLERKQANGDDMSRDAFEALAIATGR